MDAWLFFGLVLPFASFVLSILEELFLENEEQVNLFTNKIRNTPKQYGHVLYFISEFSSIPKYKGRIHKVIFSSSRKYDDGKNKKAKDDDIQEENCPTLWQSFPSKFDHVICICLFHCSHLPLQ